MGNILNKLKKIQFGWYYLAITIFIYILISIIKPNLFLKIGSFFLKLFLKLLFVFIFVIFLMFLTNYFFDAKKLIKHLGAESGIKGWIISIVAGIISSGPIYMWYPLLADLKNKGMKPSLIACFLYNRAIKPALLPLMVIYFGLPYTLILSFLMIIFSILDGIIVEKIIKDN